MCQAFDQLKEFLSSSPVIQKPVLGQLILVYLFVSKETVSSVLIQEVQGEQRPIYFFTKTLQDAETRYQTIEKVVLAFGMTARKLRAYFHNHEVVVKTDYPIVKSFLNQIWRAYDRMVCRAVRVLDQV